MFKCDIPVLEIFFSVVFVLLPSCRVPLNLSFFFQTKTRVIFWVKYHRPEACSGDPLRSSNSLLFFASVLAPVSPPTARSTPAWNPRIQKEFQVFYSTTAGVLHWLGSTWLKSSTMIKAAIRIIIHLSLYKASLLLSCLSFLYVCTSHNNQFERVNKAVRDMRSLKLWNHHLKLVKIANSIPPGFVVWVVVWVGRSTLIRSSKQQSLELLILIGCVFQNKEMVMLAYFSRRVVKVSLEVRNLCRHKNGLTLETVSRYRRSTRTKRE